MLKKFIKHTDKFNFCTQETVSQKVEEKLQGREMQIEKQLNIFRACIFVGILALDYLSYSLMDSHCSNYIREGWHTFLSLLLVAIVHVFLIKKGHKPWVKYATVSIDIISTTHFPFAMIKHGMPFPIEIAELLLIVSIVLIMFNSLSSIRNGKRIVIYSGALTVSCNTFMYAMNGELVMIGIYTSVFISMLSFFNWWISGKIRNSFINNIKLEFAFTDISEANKAITNQRDEIEAQLHEIAAQRDEIIAQRDEIEVQRDYIEDQHNILSRHKQELEDSITYSFRIQKAILPPDYYVKSLLPNSFIFYKPKDIVSGDFYFIERLNNKVIFSVVDCTGHGVPGAMMSVIGYNLLSQAVKIKGMSDPSQILTFLDEGVTETLRQYKNESGVKDGMDLTVCTIDLDRKILQVAAAYNPLYISRKGEIHKIKADRFPIGSNFDGKADEYSNYEVMLEPGDNLYLTTDGFADQFGGPKGKKYKLRPMREFLQSISSLSVEEQHQQVEKEFLEWMGANEQVDDVCLMGLKIE